MSNINALPTQLCTGCSSCVNVCPQKCIHMVCDCDGFLYPQVDETNCIACSLCEKVCPVLSPLERSVKQPYACAVYSKDDAVRRESSSGGVFSEVAKIVLANGGAVFGAAYNAHFQVIHICVESEKDLAKLRGAKYAQSDLLDSFSDAKYRLDKGQQVLFSGTPCQIAGLKSFLRKDYNNLFLVDFVCHGIPSPVAWRNYVQYRANQDNQGRKPVAVNLRSKETGWSRYRYSNLFEYDTGLHYMESNGNSLYMKLFVEDYINRASCASCQFKGYARCSDLTIGDFWGVWDIVPEMDDDRGTSVVLVQSDKGKNLLDLASSRLVMKTIALEQASAQNPSMVKSAPGSIHRSEALQLTRAGNFDHCKKLFASPKNRLGWRILRKLKKLMHRIAAT